MKGHWFPYGDFRYSFLLNSLHINTLKISKRGSLKYLFTYIRWILKPRPNTHYLLLEGILSKCRSKVGGGWQRRWRKFPTKSPDFKSHIRFETHKTFPLKPYSKPALPCTYLIHVLISVNVLCKTLNYFRMIPFSVTLYLIKHHRFLFAYIVSLL